MGYAQELDRRMSKFSNFAVSFTIISILSGCLTLYGYGLLHGGPPVMLWGWLLVGTLVIFAGMSLGEICSAFPTAGGLYYWSAKLAPGKSGPIWSWFTGWFNLLGQVAVTAGISFGCAFSISAFLAIWTGDAYWLDAGYTIGILAVVLFVQGLLNTFSVRLVALLNDVSVYWHLVGVAIIFVLLFWAPESGSHQSIGFLFGSEGWKAFEGLSGFTIPLYVMAHRPLERAVHVHRLRRFGPCVRGDGPGADLRPEGHRQLHLDLHGRRLHPADRRQLRDPAHLPGHHRRRRVHGLRQHRRPTSCRGRPSSSTLPAAPSACCSSWSSSWRSSSAACRRSPPTRAWSTRSHATAPCRSPTSGTTSARATRPRAYRLARRRRGVHPGAAVPLQRHRLLPP